MGLLGLAKITAPQAFLTKRGEKAVAGYNPPATSHIYSLVFLPSTLNIFKTKSLQLVDTSSLINEEMTWVLPVLGSPRTKTLKTSI